MTPPGDGGPDEGQTWRLSLNKYQRDNLLWLLRMCGYPGGNADQSPPFTMANTGDWIGEVHNMLDPQALGDIQPNRPSDDIRMGLDCRPSPVRKDGGAEHDEDEMRRLTESAVANRETRNPYDAGHAAGVREGLESFQATFTAADLRAVVAAAALDTSLWERARDEVTGRLGFSRNERGHEAAVGAVAYLLAWEQRAMEASTQQPSPSPVGAEPKEKP